MRSDGTNFEQEETAMQGKEWETCNSLREEIANKPLVLKRLPPQQTKMPYVINIFGWKGCGKSSLVNTIAQSVKSSMKLETIATTANAAEIDSSHFPRLYEILPNLLYVADFPGWPLKYSINHGEIVIDTSTPLKYFKEQMWNVGQVCCQGGLEGVLPGKKDDGNVHKLLVQ